jgi:hypothetical protein
MKNSVWSPVRVRPFAFAGVEKNAREHEIENGFTTIARRANSHEKIPASRDSVAERLGGKIAERGRPI